jgi:hypothetical protein
LFKEYISHIQLDSWAQDVLIPTASPWLMLKRVVRVGIDLPKISGHLIWVLKISGSKTNT